jgi:hypothetical protein
VLTRVPAFANEQQLGQMETKIELIIKKLNFWVTVPARQANPKESNVHTEELSIPINSASEPTLMSKMM